MTGIRTWRAGWQRGWHGAAWRRRRPAPRGPGRSRFRRVCPVTSLRATPRRCGSTQQLAHPGRARVGSACWPRQRDGGRATADLDADWLSGRRGRRWWPRHREPDEAHGLIAGRDCVGRRLSPLMDPAPQQVGVDAVSHRYRGHRDARLLRRLHCLRLELGVVNSPPAASRCLVHGAYASIKSLMDTSILGTAQRINMTCQDAYDCRPRILERPFGGVARAQSVRVSHCAGARPSKIDPVRSFLVTNRPPQTCHLRGSDVSDRDSHSVRRRRTSWCTRLSSDAAACPAVLLE